MRRFDQRQRLNQLLPPGLGRRAERAFHLAQRLAPLALRFGRHQVGEAFDRGEIELAVLEGAAGEFAGLGRSQALDAAERVEHRGDHRAAAVQLQLGYVLAGLALRRRKPQRQRLVDDVVGLGSRMRASAALRGEGTLPVSALQRRAGARAGNADDGDGRRRAAGGEGEDGGKGNHLNL